MVESLHAQRLTSQVVSGIAKYISQFQKLKWESSITGVPKKTNCYIPLLSSSISLSPRAIFGSVMLSQDIGSYTCI